MRWDVGTRVDYKNLQEFGSPELALVCNSDSVKERKLLPRSLFGQFVEMESDIWLIKVFIRQLHAFRVIRRSDFRTYDNYPLPGVDSLHRGIDEKVEEAHLQHKNAESMLVEALLVANLYGQLSCFGEKNESIQIVLKAFRNPANTQDGETELIENSTH